MSDADDTPETRMARLLLALRSQGVTDARVLSAIETTPRPLFTQELFKERAFEDSALPIACGQTISQPFVVGLMTQALKIDRRDRVLEIGTGSGYLTALLASRTRDVTSVEIDAATAAEARAKLSRHGFANVRVHEGDGARGFGDKTYEAIVLTGSTPLLPPRFIEQLAPGGRVFAVVGELPVMTARLTRLEAPGATVATDLFETVIAPLRNALAPARFAF